MNTLYTLADCSWDFPRRERLGVKTRSGLCQCSVLGKIDQREFCSLQSGIKAGRRVDSAPQSNRGCRPPDPLHQILCSVFILVTHSFRATSKYCFRGKMVSGTNTSSAHTPSSTLTRFSPSFYIEHFLRARHSPLLDGCVGWSPPGSKTEIKCNESIGGNICGR